MNLFLRRWTGYILILCSLALGSNAQVGEVIKKIEIRHVGPAAASESLIRANIRLKEGDTYTRNTVDDDVRSLYSTGYFYNIRVATEPAADKRGIHLIYVLQGKPVISEIRFEGNKKFKRKKLLSKISSKPGEPLDEMKLFRDAQEIEKLYQRSGYQKTKVKYLPPNIEENAGRGSVTFEIQEAPKVRIHDVQFEGAHSFKQRKLRKVLQTRRWWMFSWLTGKGVLKDEVFQEDKERLADFYRNEGFIDFEIKDIKFDNYTPKKMNITFFVEEGQKYRVGSVAFKGNTNFTSDEILKGIISEGKPVKPKMLAGEVFSPKGLTADLDAIRDFYGAKGYVDTGIRAIKQPNVEKGTMDLTYEVRDEDKGKSYIEKIEIKGNTKTKDKVIRRELAVAPGETFDMVRVKISKGRLEQMQYFDKVETEIEPTDVAHRKNLVIDVEEGNTGHVELGAGFSSLDSLFGYVGYREGNFDLFNPPYFRGGGQKLRIGATVGLRRKSYELSFTEPWFLNRKLAFGVDLYHTDYTGYFSDLYDLTQTGGRLSLTKQLPYNFIGSISYTLEDIGFHNVSDNAPLVIKQEPANRLVSKIGTSIAYDTRNNALLPNRGTRTEVLSEVAGGPLGADADFYKWEVRSSWYFPGFFKDHIWEVLGRSGVVDRYGRTSRVPYFDRYFLGGVNSLRGFRFHQVGPHDDPTGEPIGGDTMWYGSVEYSLPIIERLRFAVFYDIGNVTLDPYDFNFSQYSDNYGFGIRLNIPRLGPLRLDYGIPIRHDKYSSKSGKFQFSVGFMRDY